MKLNEIGKPKNSTKKRKCIGRGSGSGSGKTSGRGNKGQKARSGGGVRPGFEGGQMPLIRRIPKRGFNNIFKQTYSPVNVSTLEKLFDDSSEVNIQSLVDKGVIKSTKVKVKILADGVLTKKLIVFANAFSKSALEKITKAGGKVEII